MKGGHALGLAQLTNHLNKSLLTDLRVPGRLGTREKEFIENELKNLLNNNLFLDLVQAYPFCKEASELY